MRITFISNYINHHQIPFCNEMHKLTQGNFTFIQTEPMEEERINMGWCEEKPAYVKYWYEDEDYCNKLIMDCDILLFGGTDNENYIQERLVANKLILRISERLYKTGQWKAVNPRGLYRKYTEHTRYKDSPVYLLCSGAYVPSDFNIIKAYKEKMYCWGYFPKTKKYDILKLMNCKGWVKSGIPHFLWAGRMIEWKHPELAIQIAYHLKNQNITFHMNIIGDGKLKKNIELLQHKLKLEDCVSILGSKSPEQVRQYMEESDIFIFTSDRQEGWGAVANEAMNSGCALIANHMIGAIPYLVEPEKNGFIYQNKKKKELFSIAERLATNKNLCKTTGKNAYNTIINNWNAENAATRLMKLIDKIVNKSDTNIDISGKDCFQGRLQPCDPAPLLTEYKALQKIRQKENHDEKYTKSNSNISIKS